MTRDELVRDYPHTFKLLKIMSHDNGMTLRQNIGVAWFGVEIELQASMLTDEEADIFAAGERSEAEVIREAKRLHQLDQFLGSAFDGALSEYLWEPA